MAHLKLVEAENLESLYQSCQAVLELPGLEVGKIFLNVEADSILGLNQLEGFVTADDFFLRGPWQTLRGWLRLDSWFSEIFIPSRCLENTTQLGDYRLREKKVCELECS